MTVVLVSCLLIVCDVVQKLLTPAMAPGQCFPLNGSSGFVDIRLHNRIAVTGFSLEHIPSSIAYDVTSAPAVVSLQALDPPITHKVKGGGFTPRKTYGTFRYNLKANSAVQTFSIFSETQVPVTHVRLKVGAPWPLLPLRLLLCQARTLRSSKIHNQHSMAVVTPVIARFASPATAASALSAMQC